MGSRLLDILHSLAIRALAATLGASMIVTCIHYTTTRTRSRTLLRIAEEPTKIVAPASDLLATGRLDEEPHPVHRPAGVEETFEADYLYELESKSTIASDMKELADYAANCMGKFSSWWSSGKSAERQFGDSGNKKFMAREERRSTTSKIGTHGEFDSRLLQAMPVKEVAYENEPTPPVLL